VGVRRAAIFYHFRDKRELYDAVLETAFDAFAPALPERGPAKVRMAAAIDAWIEYVAGRPSVARLILREAANARPGERSAMARIGRELVGWFRQLVQEGTRTGELTPSADPEQFISIMGATTVFHIAAMPSLTPEVSLDSTSAEALASHKRAMLQMAQLMLGIGAPSAAEERAGLRIGASGA
jgi:TetR/AcrR family transcriptional regulator